MLIEPAFAKLNLALDITGKRADGYHLLRMVNVSVSLCDTLAFERASGGLQVHCAQSRTLSGNPAAPEGKDNLVYRAAQAFFELTDEPDRNVTILVKKHIPSQAGMGGGSADAAAALRGLCRLYRHSLPAETLYKMAETLGADVPFCVQGGTALAEGIGEVLTPLESLPPCWFVIVKPPVGVNTAQAYRRADETSALPALYTPGVLAALQMNSLQELGKAFGNAFEAVVNLSQIQNLKQQFRRAGALGACMTGSGSAVFGLFDTKEKAEAAFQTLRQNCPCSFLCTPQKQLSLF